MLDHRADAPKPPEASWVRLSRTWWIALDGLLGKTVVAMLFAASLHRFRPSLLPEPPTHLQTHSLRRPSAHIQPAAIAFARGSKTSSSP